MNNFKIKMHVFSNHEYSNKSVLFLLVFHDCDSMWPDLENSGNGLVLWQRAILMNYYTITFECCIVVCCRFRQSIVHNGVHSNVPNSVVLPYHIALHIT